MPCIREKEILLNGIYFLNLFHDFLPVPVLMKCIGALSLIVQTEDYLTYRDIYLKTSINDEIIFAFKENCLKKYHMKSEYRKIVRPLMDEIDRFIRISCKK